MHDEKSLRRNLLQVIDEFFSVCGWCGKAQLELVVSVCITYELEQTDVTLKMDDIKNNERLVDREQAFYINRPVTQVCKNL